MNHLVTQFEENVRAFPDNIAIVSEDVTWTYRQLNHYANYLARLFALQGISQDHVIAVSGKKSIEMIAAILAILKLRCAYLPIESSLPQARMRSMLQKANCHYVVAHGASQGDFDFPNVATIHLDSHDWQPSDLDECNINIPISEHHPAYVMHTSGSTGDPKGVVVPHRAIIRLLINTNYIQLLPSDVVLFHSNTSFDAGIFEVWAALLIGAKLVISPHMTGDILAVFKMCQQYQVTILLFATGLFHIFSTLSLSALSSLRYLVVGGDVMHSAAAKRALNQLQHCKIINGYGPAENAVFTTCLVIDNEDKITNPVSIGAPITGTSVYVINPEGNLAAIGEIGELHTSGLGLALGYIHDLELTNKKFVTLPAVAGDELLYRTGDMVKWLSSGNIEFIGRVDQQVKIRGFRVELTEIENAFSGHELVEDVCVCATENENKKIIAFVKINQQRMIEADDIKKRLVSYVSARLPSYCVPSYIEVNSDFPLTANGKINRQQLKANLKEVNHG